jgi:hypothetical protein
MIKTTLLMVFLGNNRYFILRSPAERKIHTACGQNTVCFYVKAAVVFGLKVSFNRTDNDKMLRVEFA